eukprot:sb/3467634/
MFLKLFFHHRSKKNTISPCSSSDGKKKRKKQKYGDSGRSKSDPGVIGKTVFVSSIIATSPIFHNIVPVLTPDGTLEFRKQNQQISASSLITSPRLHHVSTSSSRLQTDITTSSSAAADNNSLDALRKSRRVKRPAPTPPSVCTSPGSNERTGSPGSELAVLLKRAEPGRLSVRDRILQIQGNHRHPVQGGIHPVHSQQPSKDNTHSETPKGVITPILTIDDHDTPPADTDPPVIVEPVPCQVLHRACPPLPHHQQQDPLQHHLQNPQLKPEQQQLNLEELEDLVHVRSNL